MHTIIADYARLIRLPGLAGLSIAPVFGAISVGVTDPYHMIILFIIGAFASIYGFVLNDYVDVEVDRLSEDLRKRPLVKGSISKRTALITCIVCFIGALVLIHFNYYSDQPYYYTGLGCILLSATLGTFYNIHGKRYVGSDFMVALSEALLVLFGALIIQPYSSMGVNLFTWLIFILTFNQLVYENAVSGGIKDADHDPLMNVRNIALTTGVKVSLNKIFIPRVFMLFGLSIRTFSVILIFSPLIFFNDQYNYQVLTVLIMLVLTILLYYLTLKLLTLKYFDRSRIRRLITGQTFIRYSLVPLMMTPILPSSLIAFILIILPFAWYVVFTLLIGEKLFKPGL